MKPFCSCHTDSAQTSSLINGAETIKTSPQLWQRSIFTYTSHLCIHSWGSGNCCPGCSGRTAGCGKKERGGETTGYFLLVIPLCAVVRSAWPTFQHCTVPNVPTDSNGQRARLPPVLTLRTETDCLYPANTWPEMLTSGLLENDNG